MNWKEIKEKYPKAHKLYNEFAVGLEGLCKARDLYDFFDENGIYITVRPYNFKIDKWFYDIFNPDYESKLTAYKSRTEAETEAFNKAFEILEEKLT